MAEPTWKRPNPTPNLRSQSNTVSIVSPTTCPTCNDDALSPIAASANWPAIASLTLGVFSLVTAEFLPASLLTPIATDLGLSEGAAGQTVTVTALVGAITAPLIPVLTRRLDRSNVMIALTVALLLSNVLAMVASDLATLLAGRVLLGVSLGGFWSMAASLALRLVPDALFPRAMSIILAGVSVATVCAAPVGAWMGDVWGWRSAFVAAGAVGLIALMAQWCVLPPLPPKAQPNLRVLGQLVARVPVRAALFAVLLVISGHFAGFTYIRPVMENVAHMSVGAVSAVLLGYGIGGFFGNLAGSRIAGRSERHAIVLGSLIIVAMAGALLLAGRSSFVASAAIVLWGFAFGAFPVGFQIWIVRAAPDQAEGASGLLVAAFQTAIAVGAIGGGLLVDHIGALGGPLFALFAMAIGALLTMRYGPRNVRTENAS